MPGHGGPGDGKGPDPIWFGCGTEAPPGIRPVRNRTGEGRKETVCPDCGQLRYCRGPVLGRWQKHLLQCMSMSGDTERGRICTPPCGCTYRFALVRFEATAAITVVKYGDCRWCGPLPCGKGSRVRSRSFRFGRSGYLFPLVPSCFRQDSVSLAVYSSRPVQASSSRSSTSSKPSLPS